jgi:hypothetical protein
LQNPLNILNVKFLYKSPTKSASTTENVFTLVLHMWEKFVIFLMGVLVGLLISWLVTWENLVSGNFLSRKHCGSCWMKNKFPHNYLWTFPKNVFCRGIDTITCFPCNISLVYCWHYVTRVIIASCLHWELSVLVLWAVYIYVCT